MKKIIINSGDVSVFMSTQWMVYASETFKGKRLRFGFNGKGIFRVVYDGETIYLGDNMDKAIKSFNTVEVIE